MSLCQVCEQFCPGFTAQDKYGNSDSVWERYVSVADRWKLKKKDPGHLSWQSFTTSLSHDCPVCWTLWRYIRSSPIATPDDERVEFFQTRVTVDYSLRPAPCYTVMIEVVDGVQPESGSGAIQVAIWKTTEGCFAEAENMAPISLEHTPVSIANTARHWIGICETEHTGCIERNLLSNEAKMPARLLDLGNGGDSKTWRVFEPRSRLAYIALSHRWSKNTPELLSTNRQAYYNGQPDGALPQKYQDVISICRAIPIRYLWIDSLCILQDDDGLDFRREAPVMMDIYQHAFLTLTICWDFCETTIFRKRRPRSIPRPPSLHYGSYKASDAPDPIFSPGDYVFVENLSDFRTNVEDAPINRRAWVLQERCLSRRILYLGNDQLYWECDGCPDEGLVASEAALGSMASFGHRQSIYISSGRKRDAYWSQIVERYQRCDLTYEQDRFVAIAGLAGVISKRTGDTYLAGIWLEYWAKDLLWTPIQARPPRPGSELEIPDAKEHSTQPKPTLTAPSWSWLSFTGTVNMEPLSFGDRADFSTTTLNSFESDDERPLAMLTGTIITPPGCDPFVSFDRAILKIKCLLIAVRFEKVMEKNRLRYPNPGFSIDLWLTYDVNFLSASLNFLQLGDRDNALKQSRFELHLSRSFDPTSRCYFIPFYLQKDNADEVSHLTFHEAHAYGLLIQETAEGNDREFTGIGILEECRSHTFQLSPMISNTLVKKGIGMASASTDGPTTPEEAVFESKLGKFAATQVSLPVNIRDRGPYREMKFESSEESDDETSDEICDGTNDDTSDGISDEMSDWSEGGSDDEMVECSLLPHFATAEWTTISLV